MTQGNDALAMAAARKALRVAEKNFGANDARVATSLHYMSVIANAEGRFAEAEVLVRRSLSIREKSLSLKDPAVADELISLARLCVKQAKFEQAEAMYQRAQSIREKTSTTHKAPLADVLNDLAALYTTERRYAEASQLYQRAFDIEQSEFGAEDPDLAETLKGQASLLVAQAQYAEAEQFYQHALRIQRTAIGADDPVLLPTLYQLADLCDKQGKSADARTLRHQASLIRERALGPLSATGRPDARQRAHWEKLVRRSFEVFNQGEYREIGIAEEAVRFAEAYFGPQDFRVSAFLVLLAGQYLGHQGAYTKAEPLFRRAMRIQEKTLGTEEPSLAETLNEFAALYSDEFKETEAESLLLRAVGIQERMLKLEAAEDPWMHNPRMSLVALYERQGRFSGAKALLENARVIQENATGPEKPRNYGLARLLTSLAFLHESQGEFDQAERLFLQAVSLDSKAWGLGWGAFKRSAMAADLMDLARVYRYQNQDAKAEPLDARAVSLARKSGIQSANYANARRALAEDCLRERKYVQAEVILKDSLQREQRLGLQLHVQATSNQLAWTYMWQGKFAEAVPLLQQSAEIAKQNLDEDSPYLVGVLSNVGIALFGSDRASEAEPYFDRSFAILKKQLQYFFTYMSEGDRLQFMEIADYQFARYFSFVERFGKNDPNLAAKMYDLMLWRKGLVARSIEALRRRIDVTTNPEVRALFDELTVTRAQISSGMNNFSIIRSEQWRKNMAEMKAHSDELYRKLVVRSQAFAQEQKMANTSWLQVRDALKGVKADGAVEFVRFPFFDGRAFTGSTHYAALVLTTESQLPAFVYLGESSKLEDKPLKDYQQWIAKTPSADPHSGQSFYEAFWQPIEVALGSARRLYVSPDGILNQVSLGVVPLNRQELLGDKYDLRFVNNTADLLLDPVVSRENSAALVGNPKLTMLPDEHQEALAAFNTEKIRADEAQAANHAHPLGPLGNTVSRSERGTRGNETCLSDRFQSLGGAENELQKVYELLQGKKWNVRSPYIGSAALEEVVKWVAHPRLLHIATHGFFCPDSHVWNDGTSQRSSVEIEDPMLRSGLLFAGAGRAMRGDSPLAGIDNGILTAYEASMLDLVGTELVVLSACETGLGENRAGEGVFGLRRALQESGAQSVLMSMWRIPDTETQQLMSRFYGYWLSGEDKYRDKYEALRQAQLDLRNELKKEGHDIPYYWGAFVLVGR